MEIGRKDRDILFHMREHCKVISAGAKDTGEDFQRFQEDLLYRAGICMYILQIGELVGHLSDDFKREYASIPWVQIKTMRNVAAHQYGTLNLDTVWETVHRDIPELALFCDSILDT